MKIRKVGLIMFLDYLRLTETIEFVNHRVLSPLCLPISPRGLVIFLYNKKFFNTTKGLVYKFKF